MSWRRSKILWVKLLLRWRGFRVSKKPLTYILSPLRGERKDGRGDDEGQRKAETFMKYRIVRNWIESIELLMKNTYLLIPFLIWGLIEGIALELIYFFPGVPLREVVSPIVAKIYGQQYIHYPGNLNILPKLFTHAETVLYVVAGAFLSMVTIDLVVRHARGIGFKAKDMAEDYIRRYAPVFFYALIIVGVGIAVKLNTPVVFSKTVAPLMKHLPPEFAGMRPFLFLCTMLVLRLAANVFFICAIPLLVIEGKFFVIELGKSVYYGVRHFMPLFFLMLIPYALYLPVVTLKSYQDRLMSMTFPEIIFFLHMGAIFVLKIVECFVMICVTRFVLEKTGIIQHQEEKI